MSTRESLLRAAIDLLDREGRGAVSTRAVSAAAGVRPPALYRLFGDKEGLLNEVADYGFRGHLADKAALEEVLGDPVEDLRRSWDLHVGFGLSHPALYTLMYGEGRFDGRTRAGRVSLETLGRHLERVAAAGRLRMSAERATQLTHATAVGVVLALIATPPALRDPELPAVAREHVLRSITTAVEAGPGAGTGAGIRSRAAGLREALRDGATTALTGAERALLAEWLNRIADSPATAPPPAAPPVE